MIPKYSINFSWKKPGKSPRASGLLDPGFGRAGPRKNGSGGRVLQARPVTRNITNYQYYIYLKHFYDKSYQHTYNSFLYNQGIYKVFNVLLYFDDITYGRGKKKLYSCCTTHRSALLRAQRYLMNNLTKVMGRNR